MLKNWDDKTPYNNTLRVVEDIKIPSQKKAIPTAQKICP
jgi:hypothetical protein